MIKVLMLYGDSYSSCGMDSLSETLSFIDPNLSVDLIRNPLIALEKIKEYDLLIMGLIWSYNESKNIPEIKKLSFSENYLIDIGIALYKIIQYEYPIKTIIYDTIGSSKYFSEKNNIYFLRMPELPKTIIQEIVSILKKETV